MYKRPRRSPEQLVTGVLADATVLLKRLEGGTFVTRDQVNSLARIAKALQTEMDERGATHLQRVGEQVRLGVLVAGEFVAK